MQIGAQIKKYRTALGLSQEELAEKIYVSRQTVSNWENEKNYPDIHSLLRLGALFEISLDQLVKGDVEIMKQEIAEKDIRQLDRHGKILSLLMFGMIVTPIPFALWFGLPGLLVWFPLAAAALWYSVRVERFKKEHDIQTYKEIVAFSEGRKLDELEKQREIGKRSYQKAFLALGSALVGFAVCELLWYLLG